MLETLGSGIVYTWIRNGLPRIIKGIPGIWNGISWIGNGIYRVQEWYIQGSGMVYTGIRNGIYRDQEWYAPEKKVIIVENIDHLLLLIVQLSVCVLVYHI